MGPIAQLLDLQSKNRNGESCSAWSPLSNEPPWDLVGVAIESCTERGGDCPDDVIGRAEQGGRGMWSTGRAKFAPGDAGGGGG